VSACDSLRLDRRRVLRGAVLLLGAAAVGVSGCGTVLWHRRPVSPDEGALVLQVAAKERLIRRYEVTAAAETDDGGPAELLDANLERHRVHLEALRERLPDRQEGDPAPQPSLGPEPQTALSPAALGAAETAACAQSGRLAAEVEDAATAQLLASVAACEAVHARLLQEFA
jgi:hypothetical protein